MSSTDQPLKQPIRPSSSQLFSLFVWPERTEKDGIVWRGQLKQVATQQVIYFSTWDELIDHLKIQVES